MSQEIKQARLRMEIQLEICMKCNQPTMDCQCEGVVVGKLVTVREWKRKLEGLGAVRD